MKLTTLKPRLAGLTPQRAPTQAVERLRVRAAVGRRARWLEAHPLCKHCEEQGRTTAASTPDHIVPLWKGWRDDDSNLQSLCDPCHDVTTKAEAVERAPGS